MGWLAAIMFTDIAGYTTLMGHDEPKALRVLEKNHRVLESALRQFNGRLLKEMGDGTLSSFASALDAVNYCPPVEVLLIESARLQRGRQ